MNGSFSTFYDSVWQHPYALWLAAIVGLAIALSRRGVQPSVRAWAIGLAALGAVDAWLTTSPPFGIGPLEGAWASLVPLFFVLAGDLRYLLLRGSVRPDGRIEPTPRAWGIALGLMLVVPIASQLAVWALGSSNPRVLYLLYEMGFLALILALRRFGAPAPAPRWAGRLDAIAAAWYGCWVAADVLILAGLDAGFVVRTLANLLYYGAFPAVLAVAAPRPSS